MSEGGWYLTFHKTPNFCQAPDCNEPFYAKNRCRKHYEQWHRGSGLTWDEYIDWKVKELRKEATKKEVERKPEIPIKDKVTRELYQKLKEVNLPEEFKYKDVMNITGWKYERIKWHILKLTKWGKITPLECHSGGKNKQAKFRLTVGRFLTFP